MGETSCGRGESMKKRNRALHPLQDTKALGDKGEGKLAKSDFVAGCQNPAAPPLSQARKTRLAFGFPAAIFPTPLSSPSSEILGARKRILSGERDMRWQALALATVFGVLAGCMSEPTYVGDGFRPLTVSDGLPRSRSQKPEAEPAKLEPPKSLLDMPPERGGDPNICQVCASIRATVNGKAILDEEVRQGCFAALQQSVRENLNPEERAARQKQILTTTIDILVEREMMVQDATARLKSPQGKKFLEKMTEVANKEFDRWLSNLKSNLQLKSDDEVKEWLRVQGLSIEGMRKQKEKQLIAEE